jgi:hypothetical protein
MVTAPTGRPRGRPRKHAPVVRGEKPGPVPVPFLSNPFRYDAAIYNAAKISSRGGAHLLAMAGVFIGVRERRDGMPFAMTVVFFTASFLTLAVLFWPYMIPTR